MLLEELKNREKPVVVCNTGALPLLGVAFVVLKLLKCITWSWWLVLSPFLVGICFIFLAAVLTTILMVNAERKEEKDSVSGVIHISIVSPEQNQESAEIEKNQDTSFNSEESEGAVHNEVVKEKPKKETVKKSGIKKDDVVETKNE